MTASDILRLLNQVPPRYDLVVTQGDTTHRIHDLSYSHSPAQVTLRLVEASIPPVSATPVRSGSFAHWWEQEGSGMAPQPDEDHSEHVRRLCEIAWSNGEYVQKYPTPEAACRPESSETNTENAATTIAEQVVAAAKERRTRKPKSAPFGTA